MAQICYIFNKCTTSIPLISIDTNFLMCLTQDINDVITSVIENIINIDAMIRQNIAITQPATKNILSILSPF